MRATANTLKLAEQALASHRAKLATSSNKDQIRRQIAAAAAKVEQIRTELTNQAAEMVAPDQESGKPWCEFCDGYGTIWTTWYPTLVQCGHCHGTGKPNA